MRLSLPPPPGGCTHAAPGTVQALAQGGYRVCTHWHSMHPFCMALGGYGATGGTLGVVYPVTPFLPISGCNQCNQCNRRAGQGLQLAPIGVA